MKNYISNLITKLPHAGNHLLSGALIFGLFQAPFVTNPSAEMLLKKEIDPATITSMEPVSIIDDFFGADADLKSTQTTINKQMEFVSSRKAYSASLAVIKKHEKTIRETAKKYGVPEDVAIGVGLLENGGSETAKSPAGALGVFQLMPGTAKSLGLTVTSKVDDRRNPAKNIDAGMRYLALNYYRFGDWGLATWAYHAGEGNVSKAVQLYAKANHGVSLPGIKDPKATRAYVEKHSLTINKLLSSSAVKTLTKKLNDDSAGYPYKVLATATLFKQAKNNTAVVPGSIVENR